MAINVGSANQYYCSSDGVLYNKDKTTILRFPVAKEDTTFVIPNSVTHIGDGAFRDCKELTRVTIPNGVTSIGYCAFCNCPELKYITIPDSVTSIGDGAFYDTKWYNDQPNGVVYAGKVAYKYKGTCPSSVTIKDGTLGIAEKAFYGCADLTSITIPNSVTSIGSYAFQSCTGLTSITIPNSVTSIGDYAFEYCTGLTSITIPNSVTSIGEWTFFSCNGLTSVTIGNSIISIGDYAFYTCYSLNYVNYRGNSDEWRRIRIGKENTPLMDATLNVTEREENDSVKPAVDPAKEFKDISKKTWYYSAVSYVVNRDLFAGSNGKFTPGGDMTRGMFVSVLARLAGVNVNNKVTTKFTDVKKGQWYTGAVKWASDNGIVTGSNGKFMPNDPITREQICTIFVTYAKYKKITLTPKQAAVTFKDAAKISKWARSAVTTCQRAGLVEGSNGNFNPKGKATRAAVAQIIMNFDKNFG